MDIEDKDKSEELVLVANLRGEEIGTQVCV